jgi:hypothetical protein
LNKTVKKLAQMTLFDTSAFYCPEYNQERGTYFGKPKIESIPPPMTSKTIELVAKVILPIAKETANIPGPWDVALQSPKTIINTMEMSSQNFMEMLEHLKEDADMLMKPSEDVF